MRVLTPREPEDTHTDLRARLSAVDGVEHVVIDEALNEIWIVLRADVDPATADEQARAALGDDSFRICAAFRPEHRDRQRVRFVSLTRSITPDQQASFTVTLEWRGNEYSGSATGERAAPIELRTVAAASMAAIASLVPGDIQLKLAAVKQVRAFDAELLVVSLYRPDAKPHNLVGAVVAGDDPHRASALAVLSALNRLLGNYLALP